MIDNSLEGSHEELYEVWAQKRAYGLSYEG